MSQNGVVRLIFSICFQWCVLSDMSGCSIVCILSLCLAFCVCGYVSQSETPGFMRESPLSFWSSEGKYPRQVQKARVFGPQTSHLLCHSCFQFRLLLTEWQSSAQTGHRQYTFQPVLHSRIRNIPLALVCVFALWKSSAIAAGDIRACILNRKSEEDDP